MNRIISMITMCLWLGAAFAFTPREGAEVLIVDPSGQNILGHGVISDGRLVLSLSPDTGSFKILLVHSDGTVETYDGRRQGLHQLEIEVEPGRHVQLSDLLADANVQVAVNLTDRAPPRAERDDPETDDDRGTRSPASTGPDPSERPPLPALPVTPPIATPIIPPPVGIPTDGRGDDEGDEDDDADDEDAEEDDDDNDSNGEDDGDPEDSADRSRSGGDADDDDRNDGGSDGDSDDDESEGVLRSPIGPIHTSGLDAPAADVRD